MLDCGSEHVDPRVGYCDEDSMEQCSLECTFGYLKDGRGCETCACEQDQCEVTYQRDGYFRYVARW